MRAVLAACLVILCASAASTQPSPQRQPPQRQADVWVRLPGLALDATGRAIGVSDLAELSYAQLWVVPASIASGRTGDGTRLDLGTVQASPGLHLPRRLVLDID